MHYPSILIVDDDEDDQFLLQQGFFQNGIEDLGIFSDGLSALKYLSIEAKVLPKLIVSDFNMPTLTGLELIARIKKAERLKDIPVIIFSSHNPASQVANCIQSGAAGYFLKPSRFDEIGKIIKEVINQVALPTT